MKTRLRTLCEQNAAQRLLVDRHWLTTSRSDEFSRAAATLSLSASCLFTEHVETQNNTNIQKPSVWGKDVPFLLSLPASSEAWVPGVMWTSIWAETKHKNHNVFHMNSCVKEQSTHSPTLNLSGRERSSFTLIDRPMSVAMLQWGMVGVNATLTMLSASFTWGAG